MRAKKKTKKYNIQKIVNLKNDLLLIAFLMILGTLFYVFTAKNNAEDSLDKSDGPEITTPANKKQAASSPPASSSSKKTSHGSAKPATNNAPFAISKVYFAKVATRISGPTKEADCHVGDIIKYRATAQVTATNTGTAQYHWETANRLTSEFKKYDTESVTFSSAGTKEVTHDFDYVVAENSIGGFYDTTQNTLYFNAFVTDPNDMYANKDKPVYVSKWLSNEGWTNYFVWGTWKEPCTNPAGG
jgi:cytoskeletal protein RodZ